MYPRVNYEMTEEDLQELLDSCKPVPMIMLQCGPPSSPQDNANRAWAQLGKRMGFDYMTVQPIPGKGTRFFTAVPSETEEQRQAREVAEAEAKRQEKIKTLESEIAERVSALEALKV